MNSILELITKLEQESNRLSEANPFQKQSTIKSNVVNPSNNAQNKPGLNNNDSADTNTGQTYDAKLEANPEVSAIYVKLNRYLKKERMTQVDIDRLFTVLNMLITYSIANGFNINNELKMSKFITTYFKLEK